MQSQNKKGITIPLTHGLHLACIALCSAATATLSLKVHEQFKAGHGDARSVLPLHNLRLPVRCAHSSGGNAPHGACSARMGMTEMAHGEPTDPTQPPGACPDKEYVR
jgi:hypothetical protein